MNAVVKSILPAAPATEVADASEYGHRRVMSGPGGLYEAGGALRDKLCVLDSGEVLYVRGRRTDDDVMAFEDDLRRSGLVTNFIPTSLQVIRDLYAGGAQVEPAEKARSTSTMQKRALAYIADAMRVNASDVYIVRDGGIANVQRRVNGLVEWVDDMRGEEGQELQSCIYQSMSTDSSEIFKPEEPQDGRLKEEFVNKAGLFGARIATHPTRGGQMMVIRLLHGRNDERTLLDLGYLPEQLALIERLTKKVSGINVFSGPTGSGKSTSLQVLFAQLIANFKNQINALTIENPIEYEIRGAKQTPLLKGADGWARSVKSMMRLDPDVLLVGEIRDPYSAAAAFDLALAGHGIWSTVHANDAATILQRLSRFGVDASEWGDHTVVTGLINQVLVPTLCPKCKVKFAPELLGPGEEDVAERVRAVCNVGGVFMAGPGCSTCRSTGVAGRAVIAEVIPPDHTFMRLYRDQGKAEAVNYWRTQMGGITKLQHLIRRINEGYIDPRHGEAEVGLLDEEAPTLRAVQ